jgi:hypothetical protein
MVTAAARARRRFGTAASVLIAIVGLAGLHGFTPPLQPVRAQAQDAAAPQNAKIWIENRHAIEEYLRNAEVVKIDAIGIGVTSPRRAYLAPGGPFDSFTWKPIKPGRYQGFWESYKSEIAAYELDKFLKIDMMPPAVERKVDGDVGAAVMWASPVKSFKQLGGVPSPPEALRGAWTRQIIKAKMIDNLIANIDPNLGNWLVDPAWNIILIDHSRAFTDTQDMTHEMANIDAALWDRMKALDHQQLTTVLGSWLSADEIGSLLRRRDKMQTIVDRLLKKRGAAPVLQR